MRKIRICLWGAWYSSKNIGDCAILMALKESLGKVFEDPEIIVFSRNREFIEAEYGVRAFSPFRGIPQIIGSIRRSDLLLIGGGTPFLNTLHQLLTVLFYFFWAKIFSKKIMTFAISSQDIRFCLGKIIARSVLNNMALLTVRETDTKRIFEKIGVTKEIILTKDPALLLQPAEREKIEAIFEEEKIPTGRPLIGFCPKFISDKDAKKYYHKEYNKEAVENYIQILAQAADKLSLEATPIFIPFHDEGPHNDYKVISEVMARMKNPQQAFVMKSYYKAREVLGIISRLDVLIGSRFHSLVFAAASVVPMIAISYDPKTSGFLKDLGQSEYLCELAELNFKDFQERIDCILLNRVSVRKALQEKSLQFKKEAFKNIERVRDLFSS